MPECIAGAGAVRQGGGIDKTATALAAGDDAVSQSDFPGSHLNGGFTVLELRAAPKL